MRTRHPSNSDKLYIGIDNGVTGTIASIYNNYVKFLKTPVKSEQNYTKKKGNISRIEFNILNAWFESLSYFHASSVFCLIERPMVNPGRFAASISALRSLEATLILIENHKIPFQYIDSKEWQRVMLPKGSKKEQLKIDSKNIGIRLFPNFADKIRKHKDADGLLITEYCRRYY